MGEQSQDYRELSPEPSAMGGPPSQQSPQRPLSATAPGESSLLQHSLFSFSADGSVYEDCEDDSLPTLSVVPPSPLSRPSSSLFDDADLASRQQSQSRRSHLKSTPLPYLRSRNRQPPVPEVHLDNDEDTFFEDRSLEHRARQTLVHTPDTERSIPTEALPEEEPSSADVARVHRNALQAIKRLKVELMNANEKIRAMDRENKTVVKERDELRGRFQGRDSSSQSQLIDLEEHVYQLEGTAETFKAQNADLEAKVRAAAREKKDFMHKRLAADNRQKAMKTEIDRLKADLETKSELETKITGLEKENGNFKKERLELSSKIASLLEEGSESMHQKADSEAKDREIERLKSECTDNVARIHELEADLKGANEELNQVTEASKQKIESLEAELRESNDNMKTLRSEFSPRSKSSLRGPASPSRRTSTNLSMSNVRFHTESPADDSAGATLDTSIAERLARIRDSAERANLVRAHKREMARVKAEKEAQIKKLSTDHEDALRKLVKQSEAKMNTRFTELKASLEQEYEEKLEEVETRYRKQISEMQDESNKQTEAADESFSAAMTKMATTMQQYERETARRDAMEKQVKQLNKQLEDDRNRLKNHHTTELERRRTEWEEERSTLLEIIQKECNSAFERKRMAWSKSGATSVTNGADFFSELLTVDTTNMDAPSIGRKYASRVSPSPSVISPTFSDIASVLRQTEELVESIL